MCVCVCVDKKKKFQGNCSVLTNVEAGKIRQEGKNTCAAVLVKVHSDGEIEVF